MSWQRKLAIFFMPVSCSFDGGLIVTIFLHIEPKKAGGSLKALKFGSMASEQRSVA